MGEALRHSPISPGPNEFSSVALSTGDGELPLIDLERRDLEARDQLAVELDRVAETGSKPRLPRHGVEHFRLHHLEMPLEGGLFVRWKILRSPPWSFAFDHASMVTSPILTSALPLPSRDDQNRARSGHVAFWITMIADQRV